MKTTTIVCDKCGKDISTSRVYSVVLPYYGFVEVRGCGNSIIETYTTNDIYLKEQDLCTNCIKELIKFMEEKKEIGSNE